MDYLGLNNIGNIGEDSEIKVVINGKPISSLLDESWFLKLIEIVPELKTLLVNGVLTGVCLSPMTFTFQVNGMKHADDTSTASVKLMTLGYKVNIL
jgi:intracellular sulfur oxidation DsrE/DsrF family protein